ncbi:MAG: hypothetical protein H6579_04775 [Chitinophagales bacterium]|nr:hypothetical protein [Chitinophagales bacterium]
MKKIQLLLALLITSSLSMGQNYAPIGTENFVFSSGSKECFVVSFEAVNKAELEEALKDYLKNYKAKLESVKGASEEFVVNEAVLSDINQNNTNMTFKLLELEGNAKLYANYTMGDKVVNATNTPNEVGGYKAFTEAIAKKAVQYAYANLIKAKEGLIKDQEKDLKSLEKDEEKEHDAIGKARKEIKDSEATISTLESSLSNQRNLLNAKNKEVNAKEAEIASVSVKTLESNIKDIEKEISSLEKDNVKTRETIAKTNGEIAVEQTNLETLTKSIAAQKSLLAVNSDKKTLKDIQNLQKEEGKILAGIEELKGENRNSESAINNNLNDISKKKQEIAKIQQEINNHNEDALKEQLKLLQKDAKEMENQVDKTQKEIEKEKSQISKNEESIRKSEAEIASLKDAQKAKQAEIDASKADLKNLSAKQASFK